MPNRLNIIACCFIAFAATFVVEGRAEEVWSGTLKAGVQLIKMQFRVLEKDGGKTAQLDVISQGANGIPANVEIDGDNITFEVKAIASKFVGKQNSEGDTLEGHWLQGGAKLPLKLSKVETAESPDSLWENRPQFPKPPFPYDIREVTCENKQDGITLAGTLTVPKEGERHAAVVLISGSGPQDRDETLVGHKPFAVLADYLSRRGVAVLRMDDRGVGESGGQFLNATTEDFTRDVEAGIDFLRTVNEIDAAKIGLMGHSEGGLVAPMVAARRDDVALIVLLAGPGVPGKRIVESQSALILRAEGASEKKIRTNRKFLDAGLEIVRTSQKGDDLKAKMSAEVDRLIAELDDDMKPEYESAKEAIV
ncbi:MAG: alpha/beta hydrolase family protein, partial [Rubripirellula sp.]